MKILIKADDIRNGNYWDNFGCPVAIAFSLEFPNARISCGGSYVRVNDDVYLFNSDDESYLANHVGEKRGDTKDLNLRYEKE